MTRRLAVVALLACAAGTSFPAHARAAREQQQMYVTVTDNKGKPVKNLTSADFAISIDGAAQEIVDVKPATDPASVVILTDRLGLTPTYGPLDIRQALSDFIKVLRTAQPDTKFALTTFDGPVIQVTKFHDCPIRARQAARPVVHDRPGRRAARRPAGCRAGTCFTAPSERRVIFTVYAGYRPDISAVRTDAAAEMLRLSRASLWAIEVLVNETANYSGTSREIVVDRGGALSGGMKDVVASSSGMDSMAKRMAELIGAQYAVTYAPAGGSATSKVAVGVRGTGLHVLAPGWSAHR